ncbi:acetyl-CoA synthetase-like protein [Guyanagaster necrorhizus]|uniref:Acetyl-CoA synthetase-like protein n=1 Tax=Guyanagaster necrorhizus TaxID=856835 RepID=A0A9P7W311_9AGAR|nr:acetyl-CoA synthetase-like protein [Guyanagaster necrorhizus MCA 3950]KAG7450401.1 acetyl-CoA synthetase-like protein [Guyanagaster necrorhizus MCA 3950]
MSSTHLSVLEASASRFPSRPVFRTPQVDPTTSHIIQWQTVTYRQFLLDVENFARHWSMTLGRDRIPQRSVIGLWIGGFTYIDVLHIYGISRAGYVPQMFSLRLPNPDVIFELLHRANAQALVFDSSFQDVLKNTSLPIHPALNTVEAALTAGPLPILPQCSPDDIALMFHTSGSTSGSPKLVPCTYRWLNATVHKSSQISKPFSPVRQDVTTWMGSMCHIGQSFMLIGTLQHGSCVIQPTMIDFSPAELVDMIHRCHLNRLRQFAAFLAKQLRASRHDTKLLSLLAGLDEVLYTGMSLPREDEEWAYHNGLPIKNLFGSTECGATLISVGGCDPSAPLLRSLEGVSYSFVPINPEQNEAGHQSTARMLEFIIRAESGDCPHPSLRSADGHFHTGDLFQEAAPGSYVFRGRDDDWIKSENSLRCDTKAVEDNVRATCAGLVADCIVVGTGRPSPVLFVEPADDIDPSRLKKEIIRKTRHFHSRRYLHERISSPNMIIVVPRQTLPRTATKGNIRRQEVETRYKAELDQVYGLVR